MFQSVPSDHLLGQRQDRSNIGNDACKHKIDLCQSCPALPDLIFRVKRKKINISATGLIYGENT